MTDTAPLQVTDGSQPAAPAAEEKLPKLSASEFRAYNSMADHMDIFFCHHLHTHHGIEEEHIFPVLARKMPAFRKELELLAQHKQIHKGLDKFQEYLEDCRNGEKELRLEEMKVLMDSFGKVLWEHLDDEVKELGAQNMRKYWTVQEMRIMPM
ncbi:MAG: hypothetical protein M1827_002431 [Pycnora praestabilis]|nr:MAG: hypothetical protein M1827_002431 [Pycnora praestabilis]